MSRAVMALPWVLRMMLARSTYYWMNESQGSRTRSDFYFLL